MRKDKTIYDWFFRFCLTKLIDSVLFGYTEFVLSEDTPQKSREGNLRKLTTPDRNPGSGDPITKAAAPDDPTSKTAGLDQFSGRVASNLALADSDLKAGNFLL
jgi:hypothetical protein